MRVALISLARRGGMVHFQAELANSMGGIARTVAVVSSSASTRGLSRSVSVVALDTGTNWLGSLARAMNPFSWFALFRELKAVNADLVHLVGVHEWNPIVAVLTRLQKTPLIYTVHDPEPHSGAPIAIRASNWITARLADALVVLTKYGRDQLVAQRFSREKVFYIPYGISHYFTPMLRGKVAAQKIILYFGRMEAYKGLNVLVEAYARVRKDLPAWRLVIAGSGHLPASPAYAGRAGVRVLNRYIRDEEVAGLMQRAGLVVVPYLEATQSAVIATAYAFARPVIASDVGGLREMVIQGKTGLLVPPNDSSALAKAIETLARDGRRLSRMGRHARALAEKTWAWDKIAAQHISLYRGVLSRRGG